jgi:hypothetical protein
MRRAQVGEDIPVVGGDNVKMEKTGTSLTDGRVSIKARSCVIITPPRGLDAALARRSSVR